MDSREILKKILEYCGLNTQQFAEAIGAKTKQSLYDIINGKTKTISRMMASKIIAYLPEINEAWLLTGEGEMLNTNITSMPHHASGVKPQADYKLVPLINIDSVGGLHSENTITPSEQYVIRMMPFTEARDGDVAIIQSGNSMYPTIPPGSALLIREVVDWKEYFGYGGIFVIWLKDGRRITKEVRRYDADPANYVWCVSYNPDIADEELPKSMIRGVWKVVKYLADFGW